MHCVSQLLLESNGGLPLSRTVKSKVTKSAVTVKKVKPGYHVVIR